MIKLTEQMRLEIDNALEKGCPCLVATVSADGVPNIGYKGSVMVFDDTSLAYWERTHQGTLTNVEANPNIMVLFRNPSTRAAWRFVGQAKVYKDGAQRDQVMARTVQAELDRDPDRKGYAVVIDVEKVMPMSGQTPMQSRDS